MIRKALCTFSISSSRSDHNPRRFKCSYTSPFLFAQAQIDPPKIRKTSDTHILNREAVALATLLKDGIRKGLSAPQVRGSQCDWLEDKNRHFAQSLHSAVYFCPSAALSRLSLSLSSIVALWRCKCQRNRWMEGTSHHSNTVFLHSQANVPHKPAPLAEMDTHTLEIQWRISLSLASTWWHTSIIF